MLPRIFRISFLPVRISNNKQIIKLKKINSEISNYYLDIFT